MELFYDAFNHDEVHHMISASCFLGIIMKWTMPLKLQC